MDKIEKIRQEIERRMNTILGVEGLVTGVADNMRYQGYKSLLTFIDTLLEEQPSEDLKEAAEKQGEMVDSYGDPYSAMVDAFKAGAAWQKQKMMEGAAEHYVIGSIAGSPVGPVIVHYDGNLVIGDKVRVIIVKEE